MNNYCNYRYEYSGDGVTCDGFILIPFPEKVVNTIESVLDHDVKNNKLKKYLIKECSISYMSLCDENFD